MSHPVFARSCHGCAHAELTPVATTRCTVHNEVIDSETFAARDCEEYERGER